MDLAFGYNKNTDNLGLDNSEFNDTYSVGFGYETYIGDVVLSLGGGFEKAISDTDTEANCLTTDLSTADDATSADGFFDGLYGSSRCGNETLSAIGADIGFGDYTLSSAFSNLDTTDGSDMSVWSLGWLEHIMKLITQLVIQKKHSVMRGTRHQVLRLKINQLF